MEGGEFEYMTLSHVHKFRSASSASVRVPCPDLGEPRVVVSRIAA